MELNPDILLALLIVWSVGGVLHFFIRGLYGTLHIGQVLLLYGPIIAIVISILIVHFFIADLFRGE